MPSREPGFNLNREGGRGETPLRNTGKEKKPEAISDGKTRGKSRCLPLHSFPLQERKKEKKGGEHFATAKVFGKRKRKEGGNDRDGIRPCEGGKGVHPKPPKDETGEGGKESGTLGAFYHRPKKEERERGRVVGSASWSEEKGKKGGVCGKPFYQREGKQVFGGIS